MIEHQHIFSPTGNANKTGPCAPYKHFMSNVEDDSARKAKEDNDKGFRMLIEEAPDAFFVHTISGRFVQVNKQTCVQTGYSRQELLSMTVQDLQKGINPDQAQGLWEKVLAGEMVLAEDVLKRKDNTEFPAEVKIGLVKTRDGSHILGFFRDISKRKQHDAESKALIEQLQKELAHIKKLSGLLHICSNCHRIRDELGDWNWLEVFMQKHSDVDFSHGICPDCAKSLYPELDLSD